MNPRVSDLIAALSEEEAGARSGDELSRENLKELLAELSRRPVPVGSLHHGGQWAITDCREVIAAVYQSVQRFVRKRRGTQTPEARVAYNSLNEWPEAEAAAGQALMLDPPAWQGGLGDLKQKVKSLISKHRMKMQPGVSLSLGDRFSHDSTQRLEATRLVNNGRNCDLPAAGSHSMSLAWRGETSATMGVGRTIDKPSLRLFARRPVYENGPAMLQDWHSGGRALGSPKLSVLRSRGHSIISGAADWFASVGWRFNKG
jgi:hypothetical protein